MPIKFRCNYCRQFLGISRNRAGEVVDCPSCGRSIRVPDLDGTVAPVREPSLNSEDSQLARALDELATLADITTDRPVVAKEVTAIDEEIPQPLPEPVPLEISVPTMIEPISANNSATIAASATASIGDVLKELASEEITVEAASSEQPAPTAASFLARTYTIRTPSLLWLTLGPVLAMVVGLLSGVMLTSSRSSASSTDSEAAVTIAAASVDALPTISVAGRVSYQTATGEVQPDVGAVVLALPQEWHSQSRLAPAGLRPGDEEADRKISLAIAKAMGGGLAWTGETGEYELQLPSDGAYRLIILSRLSARPESDGIPQDAMQALSAYLQDPAATIGQRSFHLQAVEASGAAENHWDHQFAP